MQIRATALSIPLFPFCQHLSWVVLMTAFRDARNGRVQSEIGSWNSGAGKIATAYSRGGTADLHRNVKSLQSRTESSHLNRMEGASWTSAGWGFCSCVQVAFCVSVLVDRFAHINELCAVFITGVFQTQFVTQIIAFWFPESWLMFPHDLLLGMETIKNSSVDGCLLRPAGRALQMSGHPLATRYFGLPQTPTFLCRSWILGHSWPRPFGRVQQSPAVPPLSVVNFWTVKTVGIEQAETIPLSK